MNKKLLILIGAAILSLGVVTTAYAKDTVVLNTFNSRKLIMNQNRTNNNQYMDMISIMRENGFEDAAKAMENRDYEAMNNFMNSITDEEYNQMISLMNENGYYGMERMMSSTDRETMVNIHNSMMGNNRQQIYK